MSLRRKYMIAVLSPSKTLNEKINHDGKITEPLFKKDAAKLVRILKRYTVPQLIDLMGISENLAELNFLRFRNFTKSEKYPASLIFAGDVWKNVGASDFTPEEMEYGQKHIFILSGLYGFLRFTDCIAPYRLEMGTKLKTEDFNNLYEFWDGRVIKKLLKETGTDTIINLASKEYSKVLNLKNQKVRVIDIDFLEKRKGKFVQIALFSKNARGLMARYMAKNTIKDPEGMKEFDLDGYEFNGQLSSKEKFVFTR